MKSRKFLSWAFIALLCGAVTACSDDDDNNDGGNGGNQSSNGLLFDGNVIGNGDQEFVFTGKQTLSEGTYLLKGWFTSPVEPNSPSNRAPSSKATNKPKPLSL